MSIGPVRALAILASQRPSLPPRSVAARSRVQRRRHGHSGVPATWIDQQLASTSTIVHLHGGSYLRGEQERHWIWLEELARRSGSAAVMIHYRMPPRFAFPTALDDTLNALEAMTSGSLLRPGRWVLSGDEAGGGLALATAQMLAPSEALRPAALLLSAPWAVLSTHTHGDDELREAARLYTRGFPAGDARISPLLGELGGLPPVHLVAGADDRLVSDARRLRDGIDAEGGSVRYLEQPGAGDGFPLTTTSGAASQRALRAQIAAVREAVRTH